jgi:hypothetical protein
VNVSLLVRAISASLNTSGSRIVGAAVGLADDVKAHASQRLIGREQALTVPQRLVVEKAVLLVHQAPIAARMAGQEEGG